ncbi:MAG TPA: methylmalonyl-CoA mutase family protein, partial [Candidatus Paceibacterota bacterium]
MTGEKGFFVPGEVSFDYQRDRGDPGTFPFARGLHPEGYRTRKPTIRQFAG